MKKTFFSFVLLSLAICLNAAKTVTSAELKLVADGETLNTEALQAAIDKLAKKGGGVISLAPGKYLTGSILLRSGIELHLQEGATLLGSTRAAAYKDLRSVEAGRDLGYDIYTLSLIQAYGASNVKITGKGTIDGQGRGLALHIDSLHHTGVQVDPDYSTRLHRVLHILRPNLFNITKCRNVVVTDIHAKNAACWGLVFNDCEDLTITGVDVLNRAYWNNDGIDIVDCKHVVIKKCHVDAADDGICLKSDGPETCNDNVLVEDCAVESSASAVKFGTNSYGGFQNIVIRNIKVKDTFRSAIAIECVDGGITRNVLVENIDAMHTGNAIFVRLGKRDGKRNSVLEDVTIRNIYCEVPSDRPDKGYDIWGPISNTMRNTVPSNIVGVPGLKVKNVKIENVSISYPGGASNGVRRIPLWNIKQVPEQANKYPEFDMFGELPSYGFYVRHVDGISFKDITLKLQDDDFRPAFVLDDVTGATFDNIRYPVGKDKNQIFDSSK